MAIFLTTYVKITYPHKSELLFFYIWFDGYSTNTCHAKYVWSKWSKYFVLARLTFQLSMRSLSVSIHSLQVLKSPSPNHIQFLQIKSDSYANKALFPLVWLRRKEISCCQSSFYLNCIVQIIIFVITRFSLYYLKLRLWDPLLPNWR